MYTLSGFISTKNKDQQDPVQSCFTVYMISFRGTMYWCIIPASERFISQMWLRGITPDFAL